MNTAAATSSAGNAPAQNIGFAIPIDSIKTLLPGLRKGGTIGPPKAFIGVEVVSVTPAERSAYGLTPTTGALVVSVVAGAPAAQAGIQLGRRDRQVRRARHHDRCFAHRGRARRPIRAKV